MINNLILGCLWPLVFVLSNILTLGIWRSAISHPHDVLPLSVLSEYRIQHGAIGPFYVTSTYSTWKFCRRVSGFATDRPCRVWCRGLTTCPYMFVHFLEIDFKKLLGSKFDIMHCKFVNLHFLYFDICNCICLNTPNEVLDLSLFLKCCSLFSIKYSCTNGFHRRSLHTFYHYVYMLHYIISLPD